MRRALIGSIISNGMHLQQTKRGSRATGGPQYYFHNLTKHIKRHLREERVVPVALVTPYGATPTSFLALSLDAKLDQNGGVVRGRVGHDRIQQAHAGGSIGEAIRHWYKLKSGDFERIDVEIDIIDANFYLTPIGYKYAKGSKTRVIQRPEYPLSFNERQQSDLWRQQLDLTRRAQPEMWRWSMQEICRIAEAHSEKSGVPHVKEEDLLRASGPLNVLGVKVGPYVGKGYDCQSEFRFLEYERYEVPIEIKKLSSGFKYQLRKYPPDKLSRAVILCVRHDLQNVPKNVDVIQLSTFCSLLGR
jgi:hypothetical protein